MSEKTPPDRPVRIEKTLFWPGLGLAALVIAYGAYRLYVRYGASDITQAETIVYGMLLFMIGIAVMAFVTVAILKLGWWLFGRRRGLHDHEDDEDRN